MKTLGLIILLSLISINTYAKSEHTKGSKKIPQTPQKTRFDWQFNSPFNLNDMSDFDYIGKILEGSQVSVISKADNNLLLCDASPKQNGSVGKAYLSKNFSDVFKGDIIELSADYYINEYLKDGKIYLMDLECRDCGWDSKAGIRVYMDEEGFLAINRDKLGENLSVFKSNFRLPLKQFFHLKMYYRLGDEENGLSAIIVNGNLIQQYYGINMPLKTVFMETKGIELTAEKFTYVQFGVTANSSQTKRAAIYVDNVSIKIMHK